MSDGQAPRATGASCTSSTASCTSSTRKPKRMPRYRSTFRMMGLRGDRVVFPSPTLLRTFRSARKANECSSARGATFSPRRLRRDQRGTLHTRQARTTNGLAGHPTARASRSFPTRAEKKKCGSSRKTARAPLNNSPPVAKRSATRLNGRPTANASPSATRTERSSC